MTEHVHGDSCAGDARARASGPPEQPANRAGLPALRYRIGTHGSFLRRMSAALATARVGESRPLRDLATRAGSDPAVALLDAWASALDILTFYQERIANEGFLRTATERRSVGELAAAIGYRLAPGVAAGTSLAFELESAPGAPASLTLAKGIKVQSTPGPGEKAQMFETIEELAARAAHNAMPVRCSIPEWPAVGARQIALAGVASNVQPGDVILLISEARLNDGSGPWDAHRVIDVEVDARNDRTKVDLSDGFATASSETGTSTTPVVPFVLRARAAVFGANAPEWALLPVATRAAIEGVALNERGAPTSTLTRTEWSGFTIHAPEPGDAIDLDASYPRIVPQSWVLLSNGDEHELCEVTGVADVFRSAFGISARTTRLTLEGDLASFEDAVRTTIVMAQSEQLSLAERPLTDPVQGAKIPLAIRIEGLQPGRTVIVTGKAPRLRVAETSSPPSLQAESGAIDLDSRESLRVTAVAEDDDTETWTLMRDDGTTGTIDRPADEVAAGTGPLRLDEPRDEDPDLAAVATIEQVEIEAGATVLTLDAPLPAAFDRGTTRVRGNVARATHGETQREVLGGGDASIPFQAFELKGTPLTFVQSSAAGGGDSTLEVRVDDLAWTRRATLHDAGPDDRVYVADQAADGGVTVRFGDGRTGARVPTRAQNVTARYRVGIGTAGNVRAGQLDMLMSRPLGLKAVTNPIPATGGADPEILADARVNAPTSVLTLERVVSLLDYQAFAANFSGIDKAQAAWIWDGHRRSVFVTVADAAGALGAPGSDTIANLEAAIRDKSDARLPFAVGGYQPLTFTVRAGIFRDPAALWEKVRAAIAATIADAYSFANRELAQPVFASEVIACIQSVPGVLAVDLDEIAFTGSAPASQGVLRARPARHDDGAVAAAELITIDPAPTTVHLEDRS